MRLIVLSTLFSDMQLARACQQSDRTAFCPVVGSMKEPAAAIGYMCCPFAGDKDCKDITPDDWRELED